MSFTMADLLAVLDLERVEDTVFRGRSPQVGWQRVFGGLVVAQALVACERTVEHRAPHALHAFFMRPGDPRAPILYTVTRLRDGRSFATRQCTATQHDAPIFTLTCSFQTAEAGLEHQLAMPEVPPPDALPSESVLLAEFGPAVSAALRHYLERERPVELRPVDVTRFLRRPDGRPGPSLQHVWMRATAQLPDDPAIHRAVLGYLSDATLLDTALAPHNRTLFEPGLQVASLDHAVWFHRPFRADQWLLYAQDTPSASGARGLTRGSIFTAHGVLVASVAQEGLIRQTSRPA